MSQPERFEVLIVGSGQGGKLLAWHMARSGSSPLEAERSFRATIQKANAFPLNPHSPDEAAILSGPSSTMV
jgi:hypothetical protein